MGFLSTIAKHPGFLRTAGGAIAGGVVFNHAARTRAEDGDVSALSVAGTTLLGMAIGGGIGATWPGWKRGTQAAYRNIHAGFGPNTEKALQEATATFGKEKSAAEKLAAKRGFARGSADYEKLLKPFREAPKKTDLTVRAAAALETYAKPSVMLPAGMLIGGVYSYGNGGDFLSGAMTGGMVGAGAGMAYHGFKTYSRLGKKGVFGTGHWSDRGAGHAVRGVLGLGAIGTAFGVGLATNTPEYKEQARAVSSQEGGYYAEPVDVRFQTGAGRRAMDMGATGDLVFGLHNGR